MIIREHSRVVVLVRNKEYWRRRFEAIEKVVVKEGLEYNARLEKEYYKAMKSIESDIATWYQRFANNNEIDIGEAKRLLNTKELKEFRWTVEDYIKHGEENTIDEKWKKELENASAKVHITRLESLEVQLQQEVEKLYGNQLDEVDRLTRGIYQDTYYRSAFEIQKGFNVGWNLQRFNEKQLQHVIETPWTLDKMTFSDRIWKRKNELLKTVRTELSQTIIRGDPPDNAIKTLAKKLEVDKYKAGRLIMTESAYFASKAQKQCFNDLDVEKYEIVATLDSHTSEICQELDGQVRTMKDYEEGVTAPPFHPWCRTTTIPYFEDNQDGERAARGDGGKTYYVPSNITYKEWKEKYVDGGNGEDKENLNKMLTNNITENKIKESGALDAYSEEANEHAVQYYEAVRKMKYDYKTIAKRTGFSEQYIKEVKEHLFMKKHNFRDGSIDYFFPDYYIAQSWQRLLDENRVLKKCDIILLKHEHAELNYMKKGLTQFEAHLKASKKYDFEKEVNRGE